MLKTSIPKPHTEKNETNKPKNILTTSITLPLDDKSSTDKPRTTSLVSSSAFLAKAKYYTRFTLFCILRIVYYFLYKYGFIPLPPKPITISSQSEDYIHLQKTRFLESYTKFSYDDININIDKCFYDKKLHAIAVEHPDNELENIWKRRILFESTPRGSIIMHYDAYKHGFVYYSDNSNIPYFVINAVIMKYVITFRCRDFFMDDQFTLNNIPSPLYSVYNNNTPDNTNNDTTIQKPAIPIAAPIKSNAFAKLKNYNTVSAKLTKPSDNIALSDTDKPENPSNYSRNKIIFAGKICNFNLLQKTPKLCKHAHVASSLTNDLMQNSSVQSQVFSYRDFKKLRQSSSVN